MKKLYLKTLLLSVLLSNLLIGLPGLAQEKAPPVYRHFRHIQLLSENCEYECHEREEILQACLEGGEQPGIRECEAVAERYCSFWQTYACFRDQRPDERVMTLR